MMRASTPVDEIRPIEHDEAMDLADAEYARLFGVVDALDDDDWLRATDCSEWSVKDVLAHILGMLKLQADSGELGRQVKTAAGLAQASGRLRLDELTALQVREHCDLSIGELKEALHDAAPRALAARRALPAERRATPYDPGLPGEAGWTFGYLFDIIHTRDPWLHRIDICRATGRPLALTAEHDGRIVENVVADWASRLQEPFSLELTGSAGGRFDAGLGQALVLDAVEFCRTLSGRVSGTGLLATSVTF